MYLFLLISSIFFLYTCLHGLQIRSISVIYSRNRVIKMECNTNYITRNIFTYRLAKKNIHQNNIKFQISDTSQNNFC